MQRRYRTQYSDERLIVTRLFAARLTGKDGWYLEETLSDEEEFRAELASRGHDIEKLKEIEAFEFTYKKDGVFEPGQFFFHDAYRLGWGFDQEAHCWRAPDELDLRFPGEPEPVSQLVVTFDPPDVGWLDTAFSAGTQKFEFSLSEQDDSVAEILKWLEQLVEGNFGCLQMHMERDWYLEFHCIPEDNSVRFIIEYGDPDREKVLDIEIDKAELILGIYGAFVNLWESEEFGQCYWEWGFDYIKPDFELSCDLELFKKLRPKPIRSALIDSYLRASGKDW